MIAAKERPMLLITVLWLAAMAVAILAARLYTRRPLTVLDLMCSQVDDELAGRVVRERVAA